jgi:hypothetical protein
MYRVKHVFTARDGNLDPNGDPREYGITKEMMDIYGPELTGQAPGSQPKGCAICCYVKLEGGLADKVYAFTTAGHVETPAVEQDRWAHITMYNPGSGYDPDVRDGPWSFHAKDYPSEVVRGVGLPRGWHVTTYIVLVWEEGYVPPDENTGEGPEEPGEPEGLDKYPIYFRMEFKGVEYEGYMRVVPNE